MARIRSIKPEFPKDELLGTLPREVRLLYVLLWTMADDAGRFRASPALVRAEVFPYDDDLTQHQVGEWLYALEDAGRIRLYVHNQQQYGVVLKWKDHQRIEKPSESRLPEPPPQNSPKPPRKVAEPSPTIPGGIGREGKGEDEDKKPEASPSGEPLVLIPVSPKAPSDHRAFIDWFHAAYQAHHHAEPSWGKKQGEWVNKLLKAHGLAEVIRRAEIMFSQGCPDWIARGGRDLGTLVSQFDKLATATKHGKPEVVDEQFRADARRLGLPIDAPDPPNTGQPETGSLLLPPVKASRYARSQ